MKNLKQTIVKLKERGVISKAHAETMLKLLKKLDTPQGKVASKALRYLVVKAVAELLLRSFDDR